MFTTGSKLFFGSFGLALAGSLTFLWSANEGALFGLFILFTLATALLFLGSLVIMFRSTDAAVALEALSVADAEGTSTVASGVTPSIWPIGCAVGAELIVLGLVTDNRYFVGGIIVLFASIIEWMVAGWADRLSADPAYNNATRDRVLHPVEFPLAGVAIAGLMVYGFARIMLSITRNASFVAFIGIAVVVLLVGTVVSIWPRLGKRAIGGVLAIGAMAILAGGIVGVVHGERAFESERAPAAPLMVSDSADTLAQLTIDDNDNFDYTKVQVGRGITASVLIRNKNESALTFFIDGRYVDAAGKQKGQLFSTLPIHPGAVALLTFKLTRSGQYPFTAQLEGGATITGTLIVP